MVEKRQLFFKELCASPVERVEEQIDAELLKRGNCIPLAVARLLPAKKAQILQALTAANHKNAEAEQSGSRCYNFLLKEMSIWAAPQLGLDTPKPGNYNLSMEDKGTPLHRLPRPRQRTGGALGRFAQDQAATPAAGAIQ